MKRVVFLLFSLLLVVCIAAPIAWVTFDLPPLKLLGRHGLPPAGGPTGRKMEVEGVTFVEIGTGYFQMGSWFQCEKGDLLGRMCKVFHLPWGKQPKEDGPEVPVRWVEIRRPYYIAESEITNEQYERFQLQHARDWPEDRDPVTSVSWYDAQAYCAWLSKRSGLSIRLPSEAEWENACRGGSKEEYCFGDDVFHLAEYAWFGDTSGGRAHEVRSRRSNAWRLYDMHGNVWEWCEDLWHDNYKNAPEDASVWSTGASPGRVFRGESWEDSAVSCRSAYRGWWLPQRRGSIVGLRPAASSR